MSVLSGIQGQTLDITVVACEKLLNKELLGHMDPYVELEYGGNKYRTRISKRGGQDPKFGDRFQITLLENHGEISVSAWNNNKMRPRNLIGGCRVQLSKVIVEGYDDRTWSLHANNSSYAGELKLMMHFSRRPPPTCLPYQAPNYP